MTAWLLDNDDLLPITMYRLSRELDWSYGQTRGTLLRIQDLNQIPLKIYELVDPKSKKYKTKVAMLGKESQIRIEQELKTLNRAEKLNTLIDSETISGVKKFMKKLLTWDEKVAPLAEEVAEEYEAIYDKLLDSKFGLEPEERTQIFEILETFEVI